MSGETVTGEVLQFTNDNKFCYAYSGVVSVLYNTDTTLLKFKTNSEYIISELSVNTAANSGNNIEFFIDFNNVRVVAMNSDFSRRNYEYDFGRPVKLIVPPFTEFHLIGKQGTAALDWTAQFTGKVGMPQRVGNLDD
jgi:hypothetical protein